MSCDGLSSSALNASLTEMLVHFHFFKQADTWGSSQGAMFQSVLKATCEIIEYGWIKERPPVDTFIMGLATSFRERKDYEEEVG